MPGEKIAYVEIGGGVAGQVGFRFLTDPDSTLNLAVGT